MQGLQICRNQLTGLCRACREDPDSCPEPERTEIVVWSVASGAAVGTVLDGSFSAMDRSAQIHSHALVGSISAGMLPACAWLPNSTVCCTVTIKKLVKVCSARGETLGQASVEFELRPERSCPAEEYYERPLRAAIPSPSGSFLAVLSIDSLEVLSAPVCSVHLQLPLADAGILGDEEEGPTAVQQVLWAPDSRSILVVAQPEDPMALCLLATRSWQQVANTQLAALPFHRLHAWAAGGVVCTVPSTSVPHSPCMVVALDPSDGAAGAASGEHNAPGSLLGGVCSPGACFVAGRGGLSECMVILHARSGRLAAGWTGSNSAAVEAILWAVNGCAMICQGSEGAYLLRFC